MSQEWLDETLAAARAEGEVVWYTGLLLEDVAIPMCRAFEEAYPGIRAICDRSRPIDAVGKAIDEAGDGIYRCDVFDGVGSPPEARAAGVDCPADLPAATDIPAPLRDAEGRWTAQILYHATHAWNADLVAAAEAPVSFEDLLDAKWKNRMCWSQTTLSGRPGFVAMAVAEMGLEAARDYLAALAAQNVAALDGLGRDTMRTLGSGEYAIALQVFAHHVFIERAEGGNVDWSPAAPILTFPNPISVYRHAPHPAAARLFVNFVVSPQGKRIMRAGHHVPSSPAVAPVDERLMGLKSQVLTPFDVADGMDEWARLGDEIFGY